ncbi:hypothetical protein ILT44_06980 [Microvirga sp. BT689]|uniref:MerR family transcriptional regulator n=1 Tax=Microvirga arvi TaxID=2778731 RepID=UPI00194EE391|nr:hypothetical protein [Microvirga arvi]MBM6579919.1 hypothetical protein [Microvirga arvi]
MIITREQEEYSPAEASDATGVSTALQRDWRRRGIIGRAGPAGQHSRFTFDDLCEMMALKSFSDAGLRIKRLTAASSEEPGQPRPLTKDDLFNAETAAHMCRLPMLHFAAEASASRWGGATGPLVGTSPGHRIGRFVVVSGQQLYRVDSLAVLDEAPAEEIGPEPVKVIFDCKLAANRLIAALPRAPYRTRVHHRDDASEDNHG